MLALGPTRGGFREYIALGPGPRGARKSSGVRVNFLFFWSSPNFGLQIRLNISEDLFFYYFYFFFGLHLFSRFIELSQFVRAS